MNKNKMNPPILITGAARSGTSMVAGAVNICGAFGGDMSGPTSNNRKGMFENYKIRNTIIKPYLRNLGLDPKGQYPLPDPEKIPIPNDWKERVQKIFKDQGYEDGPWMYKGAKMCLFWPVWNHAFPNAKWIIVRRRDGDVANSCLKTGFMNAFEKEQFQKEVGVDNERDGWIWWIEQHKKRFREMMDAGLNCKIVWPERMVEGDYHQMYETLEWLGLDVEDHFSEVIQFVDPKLWKARH